MTDGLLTRGEAYSEFDAAADALDSAKSKSKSLCEQAADLEAQAKGMREQAALGIDRALLDYAKTHKRLRSVIDLDTWDARRADELVKSAAVMAPLASGAAK